MTPAFDSLVAILKRLPGIGYRSAERIALHLLLERPEELFPLIAALENARTDIHACERCGNIAEERFCGICQNPKRDATKICVVERVPDLVSLERAGVYVGLYHVLGGRLSPINGIGPERIHLAALRARIEIEGTTELVLALGNDIEGEATCHYIVHELLKDFTKIELQENLSVAERQAARSTASRSARFGVAAPLAQRVEGEAPINFPLPEGSFVAAEPRYMRDSAEKSPLEGSGLAAAGGRLKITRIAFGIPSGASLTYSDQITLKSAIEGRRELARQQASGE